MPYPEAFLSLILDGIPQPVWVVDEAGMILFANPAAVSAVGYDDLSELSGRPSHESVHYKRVSGEHYPAHECAMLRPQVTGETVHGDDDWFVRRDGSMFPISWWSAPIELRSGRGVVIAFTDTTERRVAEQTTRERDAAEIRATHAQAAQRRLAEKTTTVRQQVARDLHDGAQQRLVSLILGLQLAQKKLSVDHQHLLDESIEQAQAAIDELRELAAGLHPEILTTHGLVAALRALARRAPLPVSVVGSLDHRHREATEVNAYFFVAEALTNAAKHANATRVMVEISATADTLSLRVRDDGIGGAKLDSSGAGLVGLADRVAALDGEFVLESPPGIGTTLCADIPLRG
jgi:PAS domain S-box-containing protein